MRCCAWFEGNGDGVKISGAGTGACEGQACRLREKGTGLSHMGGVKGFRSGKPEIPWDRCLSPCSPRAHRSPVQRESSRFGASVRLSSKAACEQHNLADVAGLQ